MNFKEIMPGIVFSYIRGLITVENKISDAIRALGPDITQIHVGLNSPGGSAIASLKAYDDLNAHPGKKNFYIEGMLASAGTIIAMAGDYVEMAANASFLIHRGELFGWGDCNKLRRDADILEESDQNFLRIYQRKTGLSFDRLLQIMEADKAMTATEALELKFIDKIAADRPPGCCSFVPESPLHILQGDMMTGQTERAGE